MEKQSKIKQPADYYFDLYYTKAGIHHWLSKKRVDDSVRLVPEEKSILEAGCGCGILANLLKSSNYVGVDLDKEAIEFARKTIDWGDFFVEDLTSFDLQRKFEVVFSNNVLEHFFRKDRATVLKQLDLHLEKNGLLILIVPSRFYLNVIEAPFKKYRGWFGPDVVFDDDEIHEFVDLRAEISAAVPQYRYIQGGLLTWATMRFALFQKL